MNSLEVAHTRSLQRSLRVHGPAGAHDNSRIPYNAALGSDSAPQFTQPLCTPQYRRAFGRKARGGPTTLKSRFYNLTAQQWRALAPAPMDNYYVRTLAGEDVFDLPAGGVGAQHLRAAEQVG